MQKVNFRKINTIIVLFIGVILSVCICLRILYPQSFFDMQKNNKTVVENSFSKNKRYLSVAPQIKRNIYSAEIEIQSSNFSGDIVVSKGFLVQLYSLGAEIETPEELKKFIFSHNANIPNGKLVSNKGAVYIYSKGKWRPFLGAQIFENLKFDWNRVSNLADNAKGSFEEGEKIIFRSPHPDGTIMETKNGELFLVWEKKLMRIKNKEIISSVWKNYFTVKIDKITPQEIGSCQKKIIGPKFKCDFSKNTRTMDLSGNIFIFSFDKMSDVIGNSKIVLNSLNVLDLQNPKITISVNKQRVLEKYQQEILK